MSKGVQIAGGATLIALILGWYAATNLDGGLAFTYYETLDGLPRLRGGPSGQSLARARLRGAAVDRARHRGQAGALRRRERSAPRQRHPGRDGGLLAVVFLSLETPDLFKDGAEVVLEGRMVRTDAEMVFHADKVFAKCPSKFEAQAAETASILDSARAGTSRARDRATLDTPCASLLVITVLGFAAGIVGGTAPTKAGPASPSAACGSCSASSAWRWRVLFAAFAECDFQLQYVAAHSARGMRPALPPGGAVGRPGGLTAAVAVDAGGLRRGVRVVQPAPEPHADALGRRVLLANALFFLVLLNFISRPFELLPPGAVMSDGNGPQPAAPPPGDDDPPGDALHRAWSASRCPSPSPSPPWLRPARHHLVPHHPALDALRVGSSSRSASCWAGAGPTRCSAGAATGPGIRSRTPRSCRGSRPPPICTR